MTGWADSLRAGRSPDGLRFDVVSSVDDLDHAGLRELGRGRTFYVQPEWLRFVERQRVDDRIRYATCHTVGGRLAGVVPVYVGDPAPGGIFDVHGRFVTRSGSVATSAADWSDHCFFGGREGLSNEFLLSRELTGEQRSDVLAHLLAVGAETAASLGARSFSAAYLNPDGYQQLAALVDPRRFFTAGATALIDLKWDSFEDYLGSLGGRKRSIGREIKRFDSRGYTVTEGLLADWYRDIAPLFVALDSRYGNDVCREAETRKLELLARSTGEASRVLCVLDGDEPVGALLLGVHGDTIHARTAGFDYERVGRSFAYFNLAYYELLRRGIAWNARNIVWGMSTYRAKVYRGARIEPSWGFSVSADGRTPMDDPVFRSWNATRAEAVLSGDGAAMDEVGLP